MCLKNNTLRILPISTSALSSAPDRLPMGDTSAGSLRDRETYIRDAIDHVLRDADDENPVSVADFVSRLMARGVRVSVGYEGRCLKGFRFGVRELCRSGKDLGEDYSRKGLERRGVKYVSGQADEIKCLLQGQKSRVIELTNFSVGKWPDAIIPGGGKIYSAPWKKLKVEGFMVEHGLLSRPGDANKEVVFFHKSGALKRERQVFTDHDSRLNIRILTNENILLGIRYGILKWGAVEFTGSLKFLARAKSLAESGFLEAAVIWSCPGFVMNLGENEGDTNREERIL